MNPEDAKDGAIALAKRPSVMRFDRVQSILETDPALKDKLGPRDHEIVKRNGEKLKFSRGVVEVTKRLHEHGLDAHNTPKPKVLAVAWEVLRQVKPGATVTPRKTVEPKPKAPKPKAAPEAKPAEVKVTKTPEPEAPPASEPQPAPIPVPVAAPAAPPPPAPSPAPKPAPKPRKAKAPAAAAPQAPPAVPAAEPVTVQTPEIAVHVKSDSMPTIAPFLSVLSLLLASYNLLKLFDREPGAEKRLERLDAQIGEIEALKDVFLPIPIPALSPSLTQGQNVDVNPED